MSDMDTKICSKCHTPKPLDAFHKDSQRADGLYPQCKDCHNSANRNTRLKDPEAYRKYYRERQQRRRATPGGRERDNQYAKNWHERQKAEGRDPNREKRFGLEAGQYATMVQEQDGKCKICKESSQTLCVDHNHKTGVVRGLLCPSCNKGLGFFKDSVDLLNSAIAYLK